MTALAAPARKLSCCLDRFALGAGSLQAAPSQEHDMTVYSLFTLSAARLFGTPSLQNCFLACPLLSASAALSLSAPRVRLQPHLSITLAGIGCTLCVATLHFANGSLGVKAGD